MPLKLVPPREGRSGNWTVRGTYLGVRLDRSTGTPEQKAARRLLAKWKAEIERGELSARPQLTFAGAVMAYLNAGGDDRFMAPITAHFGARTLAREIGQVEIDAAAVAIYPEATPATRNRQVYTPISAVLRHVGIRLELRRPKGAEGETRTAWLKHDDAARAIAAARKADADFGALLVLLLYTGLRLSEALALEWARVDLAQGLAFVPVTKTGVARAVHLTPPVVAELANMGKTSKRVFRWRKNGGLYRLLNETSEACGVKLGFHLFRHTYATWMRLYSGLSVEDLARTGAWSSAKSAGRYAHIDALTTARRADGLPSVERGNGMDHKKKGASKP